MKKSLASAIALATAFSAHLCAALVTCAPNLVSVTQDRFSGKTLVTVLRDDGIDHLEPAIGAEVKDGKLLLVQIVFRGAFTYGWRYLRCFDTYILADGKPVKIDRVSRLGDLLHGASVREQIIADLSSESIEQLGRATVVEFKVCQDVYRLDTRFVCALHEFACQVRQETSGSRDAVCPPAALEASGRFTATANAWTVCARKLVTTIPMIGLYLPPAYEDGLLMNRKGEHFDFKVSFTAVGSSDSVNAYCSVDFTDGVPEVPVVSLGVPPEPTQPLPPLDAPEAVFPPSLPMAPRAAIPPTPPPGAWEACTKKLQVVAGKGADPGEFDPRFILENSDRRFHYVAVFKDTSATPKLWTCSIDFSHGNQEPLVVIERWRHGR